MASLIKLLKAKQEGDNAFYAALAEKLAGGVVGTKPVKPVEVEEEEVEEEEEPTEEEEEEPTEEEEEEPTEEEEEPTEEEEEEPTEEEEPKKVQKNVYATVDIPKGSKVFCYVEDPKTKKSIKVVGIVSRKLKGEKIELEFPKAYKDWNISYTNKDLRKNLVYKA